MALTDTTIRKTRTADKTQRIFDRGGLYLELSPNGQVVALEVPVWG